MRQVYDYEINERVESRINELMPLLKEQALLEASQDRINEIAERLAEQKVEPFLRDYERLKLENEYLKAELAEKEKEIAELKKKSTQKIKLREKLIDVTDLEFRSDAEPLPQYSPLTIYLHLGTPPSSGPSSSSSSPRTGGGRRACSPRRASRSPGSSRAPPSGPSTLSLSG